MPPSAVGCKRLLGGLPLFQQLMKNPVRFPDDSTVISRWYEVLHGIALARYLILQCEPSASNRGEELPAGGCQA